MMHHIMCRATIANSAKTVQFIVADSMDNDRATDASVGVIQIYVNIDNLGKYMFIFEVL